MEIGFRSLLCNIKRQIVYSKDERRCIKSDRLLEEICRLKNQNVVWPHGNFMVSSETRIKLFQLLSKYFELFINKLDQLLTILLKLGKLNNVILETGT